MQFNVPVMQLNGKSLETVVDVAAETLTKLSKEYDTEVYQALLENPQTQKNDPVSGKDAFLDIEKKIVALVEELMENTGCSPTDIRIVWSTGIAAALAFPTASLPLEAPITFLNRFLQSIGIPKSNVRFDWLSKKSEVFVSDTSNVQLDTYGAPNLHKSGQNDEGCYAYTQFLYSTVTSHFKKQGALIYQPFTDL